MLITFNYYKFDYINRSNHSLHIKKYLINLLFSRYLSFTTSSNNKKKRFVLSKKKKKDF